MSGASYRELEAWAKAMDVAEAIYVLVRDFPKQEEYRAYLAADTRCCIDPSQC
jgi:hypothetical protein